jgi:hypothetical protein
MQIHLRISQNAKQNLTASARAKHETPTNRRVRVLEAKAEHIREEAAGIALGMYARGFKDAREDCNCGCDIYNDADECD